MIPCEEESQSQRLTASLLLYLRRRHLVEYRAPEREFITSKELILISTCITPFQWRHRSSAKLFYFASLALCVCAKRPVVLPTNANGGINSSWASATLSKPKRLSMH